jgi:hypothetical protein
MRTKNLAIIVAFGALTLSSCSSMQRGNSQSTVAAVPTDGTAGPSGAVSQEQPGSVPEAVLSRYTSGWPDASAMAAKKLLTKYGEPTESTSSMLVWKGIAPFRRITVYREEVVHRFPLLHKDVIEHVVAYKIPTDKADELTKFDGSILFDRTRGELAARGDDEAMNFVALNLATDIINGKRSADNARIEFGKIAVDFLNGNKSVLTQNLQFVAQTNTSDPDQSSKFKWAQAEEARPVNQSGQENKKVLLKQSQEELAE